MANPTATIPQPAISPDDAYGKIHTDFLVDNPPIHGTCAFHLGNRMLQRRIYDKVTTGISKIYNEDVAVAQRKAKSLKDKLALDFAAGAAASKNVTTQLALYVGRELQVYAHTGASLLRTCSKIYHEATPVMYSKATLRIQIYIGSGWPQYQVCGPLNSSNTLFKNIQNVDITLW